MDAKQVIAEHYVSSRRIYSGQRTIMSAMDKVVKHQKEELLARMKEGESITVNNMILTKKNGHLTTRY